MVVPVCNEPTWLDLAIKTYSRFTDEQTARQWAYADFDFFYLDENIDVSYHLIHF